MPTLYLLAGVHRTATSSIQKFLSDNAAILLTKGYLYPFGTPRHAAQIRQIVTGVASSADFAAELVGLMTQAQSPVHSVILSDEDIATVADPGLFAGFQDKFDVKIVVSLRRQDLWLESWYLQNVKWQWDRALAHLSFEEFLQRRDTFFWVDYANHLAKYEAVFGPKALLLSVFEPHDMPEGPIPKMLQVLNIKDLAGFGPYVRVNASLSPMMTEFVRHLPLDKLHRPERAMFEKAFAAVDATMTTNGSKLLLSYDQRIALLERYKDGNHLVAQAHFGRSDLFLDALPDRDAPMAVSTLPQSTHDVMELMVAPMVQHLGLVLQRARHMRHRRDMQGPTLPAKG